MSLNLISIKRGTCQRKSTPCLLQYANNNRNQGRFNDVTIQSADISVPANRMVLSCYCSFFDKIFASQTNNQVNDLVVDIPEVNGKSLKLLIQYIYTGQIYIDNDNVLDLLSAAHHLKLNEVKEFCFKILENFIKLDNCITILFSAKQYKNSSLTDKVFEYISDNYEKLTKTPEFLNLENDDLFYIVFYLKNKLYINDEVLCRSLLNWTKQDEETRKRHFHKILFNFVNVDQLYYCFVKDLLNENLISEFSENFDLINTRMKLLKKRGTKILSVGGFYCGTKVKTVFTLDDKTDVVYPNLPIQLDYHRTLKVKNFVYCIGGRTTNLIESNKVFRLNLNEIDMKWIELAEMNDKRFGPGAAVFNNTLVICGGDNGNMYLSSSEVYDVDLNRWNSISSLKQSRSETHTVTCCGSLYTIGGFYKGYCLSSVERLDGLDQSWKSVSSMQTRRCGFAAVSYNDFIYAIGGTNDSSNVLKNVEKYNCKTDQWIYVSEMNIERSGHSACVMQDKIFVVGGRNCLKKPVKEIECYDVSTDQWEIVAIIDDELFAHLLVVL